jgi:hypothetical protein
LKGPIRAIAENDALLQQVAARWDNESTFWVMQNTFFECTSYGRGNVGSVIRYTTVVEDVAFVGFLVEGSGDSDWACELSE